MHPAVFFEVIIPLASMKDSAIVLGSTLASKENFYTRFLQIKDSKGAPLVETLIQTLICDRCLKRARPDACRHRMHELPEWKSQANIEFIKLAYGNDTKNMMREIMYLSATKRVERDQDASSSLCARARFPSSLTTDIHRLLAQKRRFLRVCACIFGARARVYVLQGRTR